MYKWLRSHDQDGRHAINSKHLTESSTPEPEGLRFLKLGMKHRAMEFRQLSCINHDPEMTLTNFTARSIFVEFERQSLQEIGE